MRSVLWAALMLFTPSAFGKPNVIVVLAEGAGAGGAPPALLDETSVVLERVSTPASSAALRAAVLTGRHEFLAGVCHPYGGRNLLRPGGFCLPEGFAAAGYSTAMFGSWQLGENFPCRPQDRGFQEVLTHGGSAIGQTPDAWGNQSDSPALLHNGTAQRYAGAYPEVLAREAGNWLRAQVEARRPFLLWLAADMAGEGAGASGAVRQLVEALEASGAARETIVVLLASAPDKASPADNGAVRVADGSAVARLYVRWPEKLAPRRIGTMAAAVDLLPTLAGWCGVQLPSDWVGDGLDLGPAMVENRELPAERIIISHAGGWPADQSPGQQRFRNFSVQDGQLQLVGLDLFDLAADPDRRRNVFSEQPEAVARLTRAYSQWWEKAAASLQQPVRYRIGSDAQPVVFLVASDWWPPRDIEGAAGAEAVLSQAQLRAILERRAAPTAATPLPALTGRWLLEAARDGHYKVVLRLLPDGADPAEVQRLGRLHRGRAHVRVNREEVIIDLIDGATAVTLGIDISAGPLDLEAWFDGQLPGDKVLGAPFVSIQHAGERKRNVHPEVRPAPGGLEVPPAPGG